MNPSLPHGGLKQLFKNIMDILSKLKNANASAAPKCQGLVFRCSSNQFFLWNWKSRTSFTDKTSMNLLKRKSCKGCSKCDYFYEELHESSCDRQVVMPKNPRDGGLYTVKYKNISTDWETGYVDDYEIEFVEYNEE